jgi:hypothetical protein
MVGQVSRHRREASLDTQVAGCSYCLMGKHSPKPKDDRTRVKRFVEACENHKLLSTIIILMVVFGGVKQSVETMIWAVHWILPAEKVGFPIIVKVNNSSKTQVAINPVCNVSFTENFQGSFNSYSSEDFHLVPIKSKWNYDIPGGASREYEITIPKDNAHEIMFERGAAFAEIVASLQDGRTFGAKLAFFKDSLRTNKATMEIK